MITDAACDPAGKEDLKAAAVLKLQSLVFIQWELKKKEGESSPVFFTDEKGYIMREIPLFNWETHHAVCEQFHKKVVIADSRTPYVEFIKELEHLDDGSDALAALRGMTTPTLRQRAVSTIRGLHMDETEKNTYLERLEAVPNYDVETDLFIAGAAFFKTMFAKDRRFFTQEDSEEEKQKREEKKKTLKRKLDAIQAIDESTGGASAAAASASGESGSSEGTHPEQSPIIFSSLSINLFQRSNRVSVLLVFERICWQESSKLSKRRWETF